MFKWGFHGLFLNFKGGAMNLTESGEIVEWPETHYVFVERTGVIPKVAP
jgi:hypothetical protein